MNLHLKASLSQLVFHGHGDKLVDRIILAHGTEERTNGQWEALNSLDARSKICIITIYTLEVDMKASVVDLRYRMNEILKAIDRNEEVTILYHGKAKGVIKPHASSSHKRIADHPFFNMYKSKEKVHEMMAKLREDRYRAI